MGNEITSTIIFFALLGGVLPAVFWLWFWLKEDNLRPEPRGLIILSFLVGMLATACAYPIEKWIHTNYIGSQLMLLFFWATTEEILKFLGIYIVALRTKYFDEPIDAVIYFITIALGFAALENTLFLINPLGDGDALATVLLGNFRFIGATLLHVAASALVGMVLALAFYKKRSEQIILSVIALFGAILLHTLFNFSIISTKGAFLYEIFVALWVFILAILLICEKIKRMAPRSHALYPHTGRRIIFPN